MNINKTHLLINTSIIFTILLALSTSTHLSGALTHEHRLLMQRMKHTTTIFEAVNADNIALATKAIQQGASLNATKLDLTPLHRAKSVGIAQLLIAAKAPLNASAHPLYKTPLHSHQNNPAIVHLLLTHKADIHAQNYQGKTPLHDCGSIESIMELVLAGAALDTKDREDNTILHSYTISAPTLNYLLTLDTHALINSRNIHGSTPLHHLAWGTDGLHKAQWNNAEALELLIAHGAVVDAQNLDGDTPLHNARDGAIARALIAHRADVNAANKHGDTPLHTAREADVVIALLDNGALSLDLPNTNGLTPLLCAGTRALYNDTRIVGVIKALVMRGANIHTPDRQGLTVLQTLATYSHASMFFPKNAQPIAATLLQAGAHAPAIETITCPEMKKMITKEIGIASIMLGAGLPATCAEIIRDYVEEGPPSQITPQLNT